MAVVTSSALDTQAILELRWKHLLPVLRGEEVPELARPVSLEIPSPSGPTPGAGGGRTYRFDANQSGLRAVRLDPDGTGTFTFDSGEVVCAAGGWRESSSDQRMATSAYANGDAFVATIRPLETPQVFTYACRITDNTMRVDGPPRHTNLRRRAGMTATTERKPRQTRHFKSRFGDGRCSSRSASPRS